MQVNGWFVFALVAGIVVACGFALATTLMRAAWAQREREALTSSDLRALEESAVLLIEQIKAEADATVNELDKRRKSLSKLIKDADERLLALAEAEDRIARSVPVQESPSEEPSAFGQVMELASEGMAPADIAKSTGLDCADVNLILSLNKSQAA
jgi:hypothetical protein